MPVPANTVGGRRTVPLTRSACPLVTVATSAFVHETAIVEPGAAVGEDVRIWHHSHVRSGATVGAGTSLGKNVYVDDGVIIGDGCKIQNNVSIYRGVQLEDMVFVGPSAVFTNDLYPRAADSEWRVVPTLVRRGATIGANATIVCGVTIGVFAMIGAGAVVVGNVGPHELVVGNPAHRIGWVYACGHRLRDGVELDSTVACPACGRSTQRIPED